DSGSSMRPRFRSESGPGSTGPQRPLELVRVRGAQRHTGDEGRELRARRGRRGGRGRGRGRPPRPPAKSLRQPWWMWLRALLGVEARPTPPPPAKITLSEHESRATTEFSRQYGIVFQRPELLKLALTHRSYLTVTGQ